MKKLQPNSTDTFHLGYHKGKADASLGKNFKLSSKVYENKHYNLGYFQGYEEVLQQPF